MTGGSGYLGSHTIVAALRAGYDVRTTVRDLARADKVRAMVAEGGADPSGVEFVAADLTGRPRLGRGGRRLRRRAARGLADPAGAARRPGRPGRPRPRGHAAGAGRGPGGRRTTGGADVVVRRDRLRTLGGSAVDRGGLDGADESLAPYPLSKVIAERAAWDYVDGGGPELVVLNPTGIFGRSSGPSVGSSAGLVIGLLSGQFAEAPRQSFGIADVRDVAEAHVRALEVPEAAGQRFLLTSPPATSWLGMAETLRERLGERAAMAPTREVDGDPVPVNEFDVSRLAPSSAGTRGRGRHDRRHGGSLDRFGLIQGLRVPG